MSVDEREAKEAEEFRTGPLSVLTTSVKTNSQVYCVGRMLPCLTDLHPYSSLQECTCHREIQQHMKQQ